MRAVLITGPPGAGKTSVLRRRAAAVADTVETADELAAVADAAAAEVSTEGETAEAVAARIRETARL